MRHPATHLRLDGPDADTKAARIGYSGTGCEEAELSDTREHSNLNGQAPYGWRWKPVDLVVLAIAFLVYWPLGVIVLGWKLWNDRQPNPQDLGQLLQTLANRMQQGFEGLMNSFGSGAGSGAPSPTGNAAFDAHVRDEWARTEADRRRIADEVAAFRAFLASEASGDRDLYERFRQRRAGER
jgi:Protein of unknown function (DUF2852)